MRLANIVEIRMIHEAESMPMVSSRLYPGTNGGRLWQSPVVHTFHGVSVSPCEAGNV